MACRESWVSCCGHRQSRVLSLGRDISEGGDSQEVVLILPGNPGLAGFYREFMRALLEFSDNPDLTIFTFSYVGHDSPSPSLLPRDPTYSLEEQIQHKLELIDKIIPPTAKTTIIGHSIGCKLTMEIFKRNTTHNFTGCIFLFPTVEHMAATAKGESLQPVLSIRWGCLLLLTLINTVLPRSVLERLVRYFYPCTPEFSQTVAILANPNALNNCLSLAADELETVLDLDTETIQAMAPKLRIYYGATDGWCPLQYRDNMLKVAGMSETNAVVDTLGMEHAFVRDSSRQLAEIIAKWRR